MKEKITNNIKENVNVKYKIHNINLIQKHLTEIDEKSTKRNNCLLELFQNQISSLREELEVKNQISSRSCTRWWKIEINTALSQSAIINYNKKPVTTYAFACWSNSFYKALLMLSVSPYVTWVWLENFLKK